MPEFFHLAISLTGVQMLDLQNYQTIKMFKYSQLRGWDYEESSLRLVITGDGKESFDQRPLQLETNEVRPR